MQEEKHYKTDRNINSKSFGVRIYNYLYILHKYCRIFYSEV